jgi:ferredoxin/flavodoxin---NADP+ reductase
MTTQNRIPARLESKLNISEGISIFRFALERDFHFVPGQYATLWLTYAGKTVPRPYSIASSPSETRNLEFYINLVQEGKLTPNLWNEAVLRDLQQGGERIVEVSGPRGRFVLDPAEKRDLVLVASGTGLAPYISMVRKLNEEYLAGPELFPPRRVYIIHGASYSSHLGYRRELESLARETLSIPVRQLGIVYIPMISRPSEDLSWRGLTGRAETIFEPTAETSDWNRPEAIMRSILATTIRPETHLVYVCGYPGTVDNVCTALTARGFRRDLDIQFEKYYP